MTDAEELESRPAVAADLPAIIALLQDSMGRADDERFDALFRWKHLENAFGASPMWVACAGERVVGLRTFMRWDFERAGATVRCVRAVDTATHPDFQGRGIFRRLTLDALPVLAADGVQFVFNTPNDQSRPGYLKMGWNEIGRAAACVRPLSPRGAVRLARSRVPAAHWSEPATFGADVDTVLADPQFAALLASGAAAMSTETMSTATGADSYRTRRSPEFFRWRYATPLLGYRAVVAPRGIGAGVAFVRLRRRGAAVEAVLAALVTPEPTPEARRVLRRAVVRAVRGRADYALGVGLIPGCVRVPSFGPVMTTRDVAMTAPTAVSAFDLSLGDLELF